MTDQICKCGHRLEFHKAHGCRYLDEDCKCTKFQPRELPPEEATHPIIDRALTAFGQEVIEEQGKRIAELESQLAGVTGELDELRADQANMATIMAEMGVHLSDHNTGEKAMDEARCILFRTRAERDFAVAMNSRLLRRRSDGEDEGSLGKESA